MRVIIKPMGIVVVALSLFGVGALAVHSASRTSKPLPEEPAFRQAAGAKSDGKPELITALETNSLPYHGGFEGDYRPVSLLSGQKARFAGKVAPAWEACFGWNDVDVLYGPNTTSPHGGKSCQHIEVKSVRDGVAGLWQKVKFSATGVYRVSLYVRGTNWLPINLTLLNHEPPFKVIASKEMVCRGEWQKIYLEGTVEAGQIVNVVLQIPQAGAADVDDITIEKVDKAQ